MVHNLIKNDILGNGSVEIFFVTNTISSKSKKDMKIGSVASHFARCIKCIQNGQSVSSLCK